MAHANKYKSILLE